MRQFASSRTRKGKEAGALDFARLLREWEHTSRDAELGTLRDLARNVWNGASAAQASGGADTGTRAGARAELDRMAERLASRGELTPAQERAAMAAELAQAQEFRAAWTRSDLIHCVGQHLPDHATSRDQVHAWQLLETLASRAIAGEVGEEVLRLDAPEWPRVPDSLRRADGDSIYRAHGSEQYATRGQLSLSNAMEYACEIGGLPSDPLKRVKWTKPRTLRAIDPRVVINSDQARRFLAAVAAHGSRGERLKAFFGSMYYAALRPEEAIDLRRDENLISLPENGWGEMRLTHAQPRSGTRWTDSGKSRERRELKHRAPGETRLVPVHPELVMLFRDHLERFGTGPGRLIFTGPRGGIVAEWSYLEVFRAARREALGEIDAATPVMGRPYDQRHAAVSTWLNAGVPAAQVAEWAGHSVDVLLRVYAKCIAGQQDAAKQRIEDAMRDQPGDAIADDDGLGPDDLGTGR
jgi:integrase